MQKNKLDKVFGPVGSNVGIIVFIIGIIITFIESPMGIMIIILGAIVGFSYTSSIIDVENKRIKFSNNILGLISNGKWVSIEPDMKIGIKKTSKRWRTYSRSNRKLDLYEESYLLILYDNNSKVIMSLKKSDDLSCLKSEGFKIAEQLGVNII